MQKANGAHFLNDKILVKDQLFAIGDQLSQKQDAANDNFEQVLDLAWTIYN